MSSLKDSPEYVERYVRGALEVWRAGTDWEPLALQWLDQMVEVHGKEKFRTRKGSAKGDVKELCEEVLPLAKWMKNDADLRRMEAKFAPRGDIADAWLRGSPLSEVPLQIVSAFDGIEFAAQMKELNERGRTPTIVVSASENEQRQADLVVQNVLRKAAKQYPSNFWLLVAVEDMFVPLLRLGGLVQRARTAAGQTGFERAYLVGMQSGYTCQIK